MRVGAVDPATGYLLGDIARSRKRAGSGALITLNLRGPALEDRCG